MAEIVSELQHEFSGLADSLPKPLVERFCSLANVALGNGHSALHERGCRGFIKRCHGDLHLRNLLLQHGQPVPFDALEFNERLGTCDVLYDLAFLVMDLGHRGLREQENCVLNEYLLHSSIENTKALFMLPLFLSCRAAIHAMTSAQSASADPSNTPSTLNEATQYLTAAVMYLELKLPILVAIGGVSGSGKSTLAVKLTTRIAKSPGAVLLRSDTERKMLAGVGETERLPPEHYTTENEQRVYERLFHRASEALNAGFSVVVDATFIHSDDRRRIEAIATHAGVPFAGLWLSASETVLRERIERRTNDASDATPDVLESQLHQRPTAVKPWNLIDAGQSKARTLRQCLDMIADSAERRLQELTEKDTV